MSLLLGIRSDTRHILWQIAAICAFASLAHAQGPLMQEYFLVNQYGPSPQPGQITTGPDGAMWFTDSLNNKIYRIDSGGTTNQYSLSGNPNPNGITAGPDGALWFTEFVAEIGRVTTSGAFSQYPLPSSNHALSITTGPDGALWFTELANPGVVGRITTAGVVTEYPTGVLPTAISIATGADGALWFTQADGGFGRITTTGTLTHYPGPANWFGSSSLVLGPDGALWFTGGCVGSNAFTIGRIATDGTVTQYTEPGGDVCISQGSPNGIAVGPDGALWYTEALKSTIGRITTGGAITIYPKPNPYYRGVPPDPHSGPSSIAADPNGTMWYTEPASSRVGVIFFDPTFPLPVTVAQILGQKGSNGWWNYGALNINLSTTPTSPLATSFYSVDGGPVQTYIYGGFLFSTEGSHQISFYSVDTAGRQETPQILYIKLDTSKPVSHVAPLPAMASSLNFIVQWSGSDAVSGIANYTIYVSDNNGPFTPWLSGTTATQATYPGVAGHRYGFYSLATDVAGNQESPKTVAEATTVEPGGLTSWANLSGPAGNNGWYIGPVTVTLTSSAPTIYFSVDGAPFKTYSASFVISPSGTHQFSYYSADPSGQETPHTQTVKIDTSRPVSHVAPLPATLSSPYPTIQWSGTDADSGVSSYTIYVSDNGGPFGPWLSGLANTAAIYTAACGHSYGFYSIATDNAGNQEYPKTVAEAVTTLPVSLVSRVSGLPSIATSPNFRVQWSGTDSCGTIRTYNVFVSDNGGPFTAWLSQTTGAQAYFSGLLGHTYGFYSLIATDNAGFHESPKAAADAVTQTPAQMAADVNGDGRVDCTDVSLVKAAIGTKAGQTGFDPRADVNHDGIVDVRDIAIVTQALTPGAVCP